MEPLVQFDMFKETSSEDVLRAELYALRESHHSVRKRAFAEIGGLRKLLFEQQHEIDYLRIKLGLACAVKERIMEKVSG